MMRYSSPGGGVPYSNEQNLFVGAANADVQQAEHDVVRSREPWSLVPDDLDLFGSGENGEGLHFARHRYIPPLRAVSSYAVITGLHLASLISLVLAIFHRPIYGTFVVPTLG